MEFLLQLLIPLSCFMVNLFCFAYVFAINPTSSRTKAYMWYLIFSNAWIMTDPLIFNVVKDTETIKFISEYRPIFWLPLGYLFVNLSYSLFDKKPDLYHYFYLVCVIISIGLSWTTNLVVLDYEKIDFYIASDPGKLFLPVIFFVIVLPCFHSYRLIFIHMMKAESRIIKIQLGLLLSGTFLMFLVGMTTDIILPYILKVTSPIRLGSSIMVIQALFVLPAILKYDFLSTPMDKIISNIFQESGDGLIVTDNQGNIQNLNEAAVKMLNIEFNQAMNSPIENFINQIDVNINNISLDTQLNTNPEINVSISVSPLVRAGLSLGKMILIRDISDRKKVEKDLEKSQLSLEKAQEIANLGNWEQNHINGKIYWSKNCKRLLGVSQNTEITSGMFWDLILPEDVIWMKPLWIKLEKEGKPYKGVFRIQLQNGDIRYIEEQAEFFKENGKIIKTVGTVQDVTESKTIQFNLEQSESRLKEAQRVAQIGSFEYDLEKEKVLWSDELYRIYGLEKELYNPTNDKFFRLVHPGDRDMIREKINDAVVTKSELKYYHRLIRQSDFQVRIMQCNAKIYFGKEGYPVKIYGTSQDVTEIRKAEEEVKNSREQLRKLATHLQTAQEEERGRISREIHDVLGQELTGIKMDLAWLNKEMDSISDSGRNRVNSLNKLIDSTIQSVRRISAELRPGILDDLGLISAMEWFSEEFEIRTDIEINLKINKFKEDLNQESRTALYRIFQEALTNIARHAKATTVRVELIRQDDLIQMLIVDNGIGIDIGRSKNEKSLGILGMQERVQILGGTFSIEGTKEKGTSVKVEIPIRENSRKF